MNQRVTHARCSWWHGIIWIAYVVLLWWGIDVMVGHWRDGYAGPFFWLLVLIQGLAIPVIAGEFADAWLAGGSKSAWFRKAVGFSALLTAVYALLWVRYGATFLLVGIVTGFTAPLALFSLTVFGQFLLLGVVGVAAYLAFAWLSLRTAYLLFCSTTPLDLDAVMGHVHHSRTGQWPDHEVPARTESRPKNLSDMSLSRVEPSSMPAPVAPAPPSELTWSALTKERQHAVLYTAANLVSPYGQKPDAIALLRQNHPELSTDAAVEAIRQACAALSDIDRRVYSMGCYPMPGDVDPEPDLRAAYPWMGHDAFNITVGIAKNNARRG